MGHDPGHQFFFAGFSIFLGFEWLIPFDISIFIKLAIYEREWAIQSPKKVEKPAKKIGDPGHDPQH